MKKAQLDNWLLGWLAPKKHRRNSRSSNSSNSRKQSRISTNNNNLISHKKISTTSSTKLGMRAPSSTTTLLSGEDSYTTWDPRIRPTTQQWDHHISHNNPKLLTIKFILLALAISTAIIISILIYLFLIKPISTQEYINSGRDFLNNNSDNVKIGERSTVATPTTIEATKTTTTTEATTTTTTPSNFGKIKSDSVTSSFLSKVANFPLETTSSGISQFGDSSTTIALIVSTNSTRNIQNFSNTIESTTKSIEVSVNDFFWFKGDKLTTKLATTKTTTLFPETIKTTKLLPETTITKEKTTTTKSTITTKSTTTTPTTTTSTTSTTTRLPTYTEPKIVPITTKLSFNKLRRLTPTIYIKLKTTTPMNLLNNPGNSKQTQKELNKIIENLNTTTKPSTKKYSPNLIALNTDQLLMYSKPKINNKPKPIRPSIDPLSRPKEKGLTNHNNNHSLKTGLTNNYGLKTVLTNNNGLKTSLTNNNNLKTGLTNNNGLKTGLTNNNGLNTGLTNNNGLKTPLTNNNGLKTGLKYNNGLKTGLTNNDNNDLKTQLRYNTDLKTNLTNNPNNYNNKQHYKSNIFNEDNFNPVEIVIEPNLSQEYVIYDDDDDDEAENKIQMASTTTASSKIFNAESLEPIWRRLPPGLKTLSPLPPPPSPPPFQLVPVLTVTNSNQSILSFKGTKFAISATIKTIPKQENLPTWQKEEKQIPLQIQKRFQRSMAPIIVTALLDIGRGNWDRFTRHFDQYLNYFKQVLQLDNNIIIYCEHTVIKFLMSLPDLDWHRIQIVEIQIEELPFYRWRNEIEEIMLREQREWSIEWDPQMKSHPEAVYPEYDILVNSKPYFLYNATKIAKFDSNLNNNRFFVWLDAGYGHGSPNVIPNGLWQPNTLPTGQITLFKLTSQIEKVERYKLEMVYRKQKTVVSGGFLAGDLNTIQRFHVFFHKTFMQLLDSGKIDDDQTTLLVTIKEYRSLFNVISGGWFDAFKLFPNAQ